MSTARISARFRVASARRLAGSPDFWAPMALIEPETWSAVRRTKDSAQDEPETIWGAPVLTTTQRPSGTAILLDTTKMGRVAVREPIAVRIGFAGYDFRDNIVRY